MSLDAQSVDVPANALTDCRFHAVFVLGLPTISSPSSNRQLVVVDSFEARDPILFPRNLCIAAAISQDV